jgi:hypothetical protein
MAMPCRRDWTPSAQRVSPCWIILDFHSAFVGGGPIVGRFFNDLFADIIGGVRVSLAGEPKLSNLVKNGGVDILLARADDDGGINQLF